MLTDTQHHSHCEHTIGHSKHKEQRVYGKTYVVLFLVKHERGNSLAGVGAVADLTMDMDGSMANAVELPLSRRSAVCGQIGE